MSAQESVAVSPDTAQQTPIAQKRTAEERYYYASQRELIWWRFTRH